MRPRRLLRAFLTGTLVTSAAYAGTVLSGARTDRVGPSNGLPAEARAAAGKLAGAAPVLSGGERLPSPLYYIGADRSSIAPDPAKVKWDKPAGTCSESPGNVTQTSDHSAWPGVTQDCIYMGGFGLGPVRAAEGVDELGIFVRTLVVSNGESAVVLQVMDSVGYFFGVKSVPCRTCGIAEIREAVQAETGIPAAGVVVASTHSHSGPDTQGGWGGTPGWYMRQVRDTAVASAKRAAEAAVPARIEVGSFDARQRNSERRDYYRSVSDFQGVWLRGVALDEEGEDAGTVATMLNFAAHPTTVGSSNQLLGSDYPGVFAREIEGALGGTALYFMGGLGNQSPSGNREQMGTDLAARVIADMAARPRPLGSNEVRAAVVTVNHPVTNDGLLALGAGNFFTRAIEPPHGQIPAEADLHPGLYSAGNAPTTTGFEWWKDIYRNEAGRNQRPRLASEYCKAAGDSNTVPGPVGSVKVPVGAYRIGEALVAFGPGELFSGITIAVKSRAKGAREAFVLALANDALGYIIPTREWDEAAQLVVGDIAGLADYEEILSIDRCFGDHVVEHLVRATQDVGLS